jgi:trehalose 6-phosphate synthase/phosphatase
MESKIEPEIIEKYLLAKNRLVLLDYDGTLVNYTTLPEKAKLPESMAELLSKLIDNPRTDIYIVTGRGHNDIDKLLYNLPVKVIAEHGAFLKEGGKWKNLLNISPVWKQEILDVMNRITAGCHETYIEEKEYSLTWHYRNADPGLGYNCSRELISQLRKIVETHNLKILDGNKIVEILSNSTGKGLAVKKIFENGCFDFVLSIGDDATDEEMFDFFLHISNAFTIKVGEGTTRARYKVGSIKDVATLLKRLSG